MFIEIWIVNWHNLKMNYKKQMELMVKSRKEGNHNKAKTCLVNYYFRKYQFHSSKIFD